MTTRAQRVLIDFRAPASLELTEMGIPQWKWADVGSGQDFVEVAEVFVNARNGSRHMDTREEREP